MITEKFDRKREYSIQDVLLYMLKLENVFMRLDSSNKFRFKLFKVLMFHMFMLEQKFWKFFEQTPDGFSRSADDLPF